MRFRLVIFFVLILHLCLSPAAIQAQTSIQGALSAPQLDRFPNISIFLDLHDAQGGFIHGIQLDQVKILEDNNPLPAQTIQELIPGAQVVVAINPGPTMGVRNSKGISRYEYVKTALIDWARSRQGSTLDDWSLVINNGPEVDHVIDSMQWLEALEKDETNPRTATPGLDILFRAVSLAADTTSRPGMGRAVLFISPPLEGELNQPLDNLIAQAKQQNVNIFVWAISSVVAFTTAGMQNLIDLAAQTNGQFLLYSGEEQLPNPEDYVSPLRWIYELEYQSTITSSGQHQVSVQIQTPDLTIDTPSVTFEILLQPPAPTFVSPPLQIDRKLSASFPAKENDLDIPNTSNAPSQPADLVPDNPEYSPYQYTIQVIFDFPDGHIRPITWAGLYVDGVLEYENLSEPFNQFTWQLDQYLTDGTHVLQVQATDSLGLVGISLELPVAIQVENAEDNPWLIIQRNLTLLTVLLVTVAGAILALALLLGGRLRPTSLQAARNKDTKARRGHKSDPVTQVVTISEHGTGKKGPNWPGLLQRSQHPVAPQVHAFLTPIHKDSLDYGEKAAPSIISPIPITVDEISLGSNPNLATLVLEDRSIEGLHARLTRQNDGSFRLSDEGSVAGTWVNYSPVSKEGTKLIHGDIIHIGRISFRFTLRHPTLIRKPVIIERTQGSDEALAKASDKEPTS